jgi:hypothetical protein
MFVASITHEHALFVRHLLGTLAGIVTCRARDYLPNGART